MVASTLVTDVEAGFDSSDDLLWQAIRGQLTNRGSIRVRRSGRIGPVVELMFARKAMPNEYAQVTIEVPFAGLAEDAMNRARISGGNRNDVAGVFPLGRDGAGAHAEDMWEQWTLHAECGGRLWLESLVRGWPDWSIDRTSG